MKSEMRTRRFTFPIVKDHVFTYNSRTKLLRCSCEEFQDETNDPEATAEEHVRLVAGEQRGLYLKEI